MSFQAQTLIMLRSAVKENLPKSYDDCIRWARFTFQEYFHNSIAQLLHVFPSDIKTKEGQLFWSGPKRCPSVIEFDVNEVLNHFSSSLSLSLSTCVMCEMASYKLAYVAWRSLVQETHIDFIEAASLLFAETYNLKVDQGREYVKKVVSTVKVPAFKPKSGWKATHFSFFVPVFLYFFSVSI